MRRPIRRSSLLALLAGLVASMAVAAVGTPTPDLPIGLGLRLVDVPVERAADPRANDYIVDHAIPGATVRRAMAVSNGTDAELPVKLLGVRATAEDEWLVDDGTTPPGPDELAAWITVEPSELLLAPQSVAIVEVTIVVPAGATDGERYAAVVAEPPVVPAGEGLGLISRVGIRTYLSVGTGGEPASDFEIDTLTAARDADGVPVIAVGVTNTGGRAIDVSGELTLVSEDGLLTAGPFPTVLPSTLGPGNRGAVDVRLRADIAAGPWLVTATLHSGLLERVAQATVTFPDAAGEVADPVIAQRIEAQRRLLIPTAMLLILLALAALWYLRSLTRGNGQDPPETASYADGDAIPVDGDDVGATG